MEAEQHGGSSKKPELQEARAASSQGSVDAGAGSCYPVYIAGPSREPLSDHTVGACALESVPPTV